MITLVRKIKVMNLDIQMVTLNAASGAALVAEAIKMNSSLTSALNTYKGKIMNRAVTEAHK